MEAEGSPRLGTEAEIEVVGEVVRCGGDWTIGRLHGLEERLPRLRWPDRPSLVVDAASVAAMDTAGAWLLYRYRYRASSVLETLAFLPMIVPEVIHRHNKNQSAGCLFDAFNSASDRRGA